MTNHVEPGGAALQIIDVDGLAVFKRSVGPMDNNAYLLVPAEGPVTLIDAAADAQKLSAWLDGRELQQVVTTHRHGDHIQALAAVLSAGDAQAICGEPDAAAIQGSTDVPQQTVWTGDVIPVGDYQLEAIGLVGHTPGSIALALRAANGPAHIFTGDSLFPGGVGKTNSSADFESLLNDVVTQIFERFADDTVIHPGHGDDTTLGVERPHLDQWRDRGW
mgnify:CR=1 FL=1